MKAGDQLFPLAPVRHPWPVYASLVCLLTWLCFGDLRQHLVEPHDGEDWTFFFSAEKEQASGRLLYEFVSYLVFLVYGPIRDCTICFSSPDTRLALLEAANRRSYGICQTLRLGSGIVAARAQRRSRDAL